MCLLCFVPPKATPKREHLENACKNNPDGFGFAFMTDEGFIVERAMKANDLLDKFYKLRKKYRNAPALFHARLATHGTKNLSNCHPFYVAGGRKTLLAHNGILPVVINEGDPRSDTKIFAEDYLKHLGIEQLDDPIGYDIISEYCRGSKLVILNMDNRLQYQWYIVNESLGDYDENDKCWYSNGGYKSAPRYTYSKYLPAYRSEGITTLVPEPDDDEAVVIPDEQLDYCKCYGANLTEITEEMPFKYFCDMACKDCPLWIDNERQAEQIEMEYQKQ